MLPLVDRMLRCVNSEIMFPRRYQFLASELSPYLNGCSSVLDVGSSNGKLVRALADKLSIPQVAGVDVRVQPGSVIPIQEYDGKTLPFADQSFDCVMFIDVLHHTENPVALLREAKRVARKHVLIKDHYWNNGLDWFVLKWADYFGNDPFGIVLPYNYFRAEQWNAAFGAVGLEVKAQKYFTKLSFDPCKHVIFSLESLPSIRQGSRVDVPAAEEALELG